MLQHLQGREGRHALMDALRRQFLVDGSNEIAERIASAMELREYYEGEPLFVQGERGGEICFILSGTTSVRVDQREAARVAAGMHVGEIGMLEPLKGRSASVVAIDTVTAAQITRNQFIEIAKIYPDLWRRLALELAHRLVSTQWRG